VLSVQQIWAKYIQARDLPKDVSLDDRIIFKTTGSEQCVGCELTTSCSERDPLMGFLNILIKLAS
jgi:hypothetical protein